ncbi:helix-turn-helix transcriptional regulator [Staphylococcus sp. IVB6214]|uniref:helix-turn-helix domain-containing protein n=1 Tax=Staphylococcus sp. IVB6214 TaxID=2989766 RepID=UPI0021D35CC6|nr:helix-turn-helix transcriptional regulator [Staphylococcus sp. IVB6214]UXR83199.1 helix-turn-helix domain-containing protein [Staphylococcus sp. IVB6214]
MSLSKTIGANIKANRCHKKWTQKELAQRVNTTRQHLGCIERGQKEVSIAMLERIANKLEIEAYKLLK